MRLCEICGNVIPEGKEFCPTCGKDGVGIPQTEERANVITQQEAASSRLLTKLHQLNETQKLHQLNEEQKKTDDYENSDVEKNKFMAALSYLGVLVLIPWFMAADSKYTKFHVKQGANLLAVMILYFIANYLLRLIKVTKTTYILGQAYQYKDTPEIVVILLFLICIPIAVLSIIGIVNAIMGRTKKLPVIGNMKIVK